MQLSLTTLPAFVYDSRPNFVLLVSHVPRRENGHNHCDADHNILDNPFVGRAICDAIMRLWDYVPAGNTTHTLGGLSKRITEIDCHELPG
jgi:hypothetical protein